MTIKDQWKRALARLAARGAAGSGNEHAAGPRRTVALPSVLAPYAISGRPLPRPTPVNLRRFAETPLVRRAINLIKDRIAAMDW